MVKTSRQLEKMSESLTRLQLENERLSTASTINIPPMSSPEMQNTNIADAAIIESLKAEVTQLTAALNSSSTPAVPDENLSSKLAACNQNSLATNESECANDFYISPSESPTRIIYMEKDENRATSPSLLVSCTHL